MKVFASSLFGRAARPSILSLASSRSAATVLLACVGEAPEEGRSTSRAAELSMLTASPPEPNASQPMQIDPLSRVPSNEWIIDEAKFVDEVIFDALADIGASASASFFSTLGTPICCY